MPSTLTKPGTRRLSEVARHVVVPAGIVSTGYPSVQAKCRDLGILHDDWQQGLGRLILGKRANGKYAATVGGVVMSIPRQVGKTFTVGSILFAMCLLFPRMTVLWTAHRTRTANETFRAMQALARRPKIKPFIRAVRSTNGEQEIAFRNGSRIMFGAREQGFGRGFAEVDVEVFDEAQILTERALEDMVAATNQSKHPAGALLFYMGTPPRPVDPGEAFRNKRDRALSGKSQDMVYVELSADEDPNPDDRKQWAKANPSYPVRTPIESMQRLRENVGSDESFIREGLGVWDDRSRLGIISTEAWLNCLDVDSQIVSDPVFALDVSPMRSWSAIAAAGFRADGLPHVEVTASTTGGVDHRPGTDWVVPRIMAMKERWPGLRLTVASASAAESLVPALTAAGVDLVFVKGNDLAAGCGLFFDLATTGGMRHRGQSELTVALSAARKNVENGEGVWRWGRRRSSEDITTLYAATLALWAANNMDGGVILW
jgi:hypothetical protein